MYFYSNTSFYIFIYSKGQKNVYTTAEQQCIIDSVEVFTLHLLYSNSL